MKYCLIILGLFFYQFSISQKIVTGKVFDIQSNKPLIGCSIYNTNSQMGTIANENGDFKIYASKGDLIQFSYIGMETVEKYIGAASDSLQIAMKYQIKRLKNITISSANTTKKSVLYNPNYEKNKQEPIHEKGIQDPNKYSNPTLIMQSPITALYYAFAPRERLKLVYLEKIHKRDQANLKYSYSFISMITKEKNEDELRRIKAHCYFSEDQILQSDYYQLGLMTKECYLDYLDKRKVK